MQTTYAGRAVAKGVANHFIAGSGDLISAATAERKVHLLENILQFYFQDRDAEFDGQDIDRADVKMAIAYVRGKKHTKAQRKAVLGTAKVGVHIATTVTGATAGSIVPVAGTALGAVGGYIAGASLGLGITGVDQAKRKAKGFYKWVKGTRGEHRTQAAMCLMYNAGPQFDRDDGRNAAREALEVILGAEYLDPIHWEDPIRELEIRRRLADRMKSN